MRRGKKSFEEIAGEQELCEYCSYTDYGTQPVNTGPYNLCEGAGCEDAYENYLEEEEDDDE